VPLVVIDSATAPRLDWAAHLAANRDGMSHVRIFPTLLALIGYAEKDAAQLYRPSLVSPDKEELSFTINYFAALGREPTWRRIDPAKLCSPRRATRCSWLRGNRQPAAGRTPSRSSSAIPRRGRLRLIGSLNGSSPVRGAAKRASCS
jgi:hypothetical protein